ncbi:hypothetical protein KBX19_02770 [Corynebacterium sp. CCUG 71335]|uniref:hypothetical protein n=1 Tax=Corynebacterium sp. CCUG 71335 TaxID=2823892 RepID=UPI00210ACF86|nr:hypothetical protein [Corynebacterium sp. CCUG 71335]MCQ4620139.1 hypothetical protein [Corynebacterium sp. CCUG 71335]
MLTSRALKTIGASVAASTLLLVAGCSSDEQGNAEGPATETQGESAEAAPSEETAAENSESAEVKDLSQLFDGVTFKSEQVVTQSPEQIKDLLQVMKDVQAADMFEFDPPECGEEFQRNQDDFNDEDVSPETFTAGDVQTDGFAVVAYDLSVTKDPERDRTTPDLEKCGNYSFTSPAGAMSVAAEELPFTADADGGYAVIQRTDSEMEQMSTYNTVAEKNGTLVSLSVNDPSEENIKAAEETLGMILDRL